MQCLTCGHECRPGAAFCGQCGARVQDTVRCPGCGLANPADNRFCEDCGLVLSSGATPPARPRPAAAGTLPASFAGGRYVVDRLLGQGGKKRVYLARDTALERDVAFALLRADGMDEESLIRLRHEAQAMARVGGHPNVVTVFDVGEDEAGPYIVSEYMAGGDVAEALRGAEDGRLSVERALAMASDLCRALEHAHGLGVVHRDIKPENAWLDDDGSAKVGDFGLALMDDRTRLSQEGLLYGTPAYMAPEQALGGAVDGRCDVYALGALLYEMVTGRPPFLGDDPVAIVTQHLGTAPVAPAWHRPDLPRALDALILRMLAKAPDERPAGVAEVRASIEAITDALRAGTAPAAAGDGGNPLDRLAGGIFVGREADLGRLRAGLEGALSGHGRLVMVAGEPGIGKTRMAEELATYAQLRGCHVLWGRCVEAEAAPPYWPWTQVLRAYRRTPDADATLEELGVEAVAEIAHVAPELQPGGRGPQGTGSVEPDLARFRLFDRVARLLEAAALRRPMVIVLDDLHHADEASLLLLEFVSRELRDARVLVVATYNDLELGRHHPLARVMAKLTSSHDAERLALRGLSEPNVERFIELAASVDPPAGLAAAVYRETEGNPFFVAEVVRLLAADGRLAEAQGAEWQTAIPVGVREAIGLRLDRLSQTCNRVLAVASVMGREFDLPVLEQVSEAGADTVVAAVEEAISAHVVADAPDGRRRYRFSHGLIRHALYEELPSPTRARLHGRIARALELALGQDADARLGELAQHFLDATGPEEVARGVDYAVRAARQAAGRLAYEEAVAHYQRALTAQGADRPLPDEKRCELLLELGDAYRYAGDPHGAQGAFRRAAELARSLGDPGLTARAALGHAGPSGTFGVADEGVFALLEEAQAGLGERDSALRAMVTARMALELYFSPETELRARLARDAVEMARRVGDPGALAYALDARHGALRGPENAEERLAVASEIVALAERAGSDELALRGHASKVIDLLELGAVAAADDEITVHASLAERLHEPAHLWHAAVWRAARAHFDGRFRDAELLADEALEVGGRLFESEATQCHTVQVFFCEIELGGAAGLEGLFTRFGEEVRAVPGWHAATAQLYSEIGREEEARGELGLLAADRFAGLPRDSTWLPAIACAAEACAFLQDVETAAVLHELLLPYAARNIVAVEGWICMGSAERLLGLLAATMGRYHESEVRFQQALTLNRDMGARAWLARTRYQYARMLLRRAADGDRDRAAALAAEAVAAARELGMHTLLERALEIADAGAQEVDDRVGRRTRREDLRDTRIP